MTRKWFLGLLGIGASGQTPVPMSTIKPLRGKPANGECPVCGTMAEKYLRSKKTECTGVYKPSGNPWIAVCETREVWDAPATRTVSCAHCRCRFDQDAEEAL